jgi:hypothetical protein
MSARKYFEEVCESLGIECNKDQKKSKRLKLLINKFKKKKEKIESELKKISHKNKKEKEEELNIVTLYIEKGEKILKKKKEKK